MLKTKIIFLAIIFFGFFGWAGSSSAACSWTGNTGTVASPYSASDLAACITDASEKTGDIVIDIPSCNVTHSSGQIVNMRTGFANVTSLTIRGQNDCALDGNERPTACGTNLTNFYIAYTGAEGKAFRLAHLRTTGTSGLSIDGNSESWRFDHIYWDTVTGYTSARIIWISKSVATDLTEGLIDHNNIKNWAWGTIVHYQPSADGGNNE